MIMDTQNPCWRVSARWKAFMNNEAVHVSRLKRFPVPGNVTPFNPNAPESHFGDGKKIFGVSWNDRPPELGVISGEGGKS